MIKKIWEFSGVRFIVVGIINTIIDFSVLNTLVFAFGLNNILANTVSVTVAMAASYLLNHYIVFRKGTDSHTKRLVLFVLITIFGLFVIQNLTIYLLVHIFTWPGHVATTVIHGVGLTRFSQEFISLNLAKAIATGITMVWNYFMYKKFVFVGEKPKAKRTLII